MKFIELHTVIPFSMAVIKFHIHSGVGKLSLKIMFLKSSHAVEFKLYISVTRMELFMNKIL